MSHLKQPSDYLEDLSKILNNTTVISDNFTKYIIQIAIKSMELNYNAGKKNESEDFSLYKILVKEFHSITIFSAHFQNLVLGSLHDCIMASHEKGLKESAH